MTKDAAQDIYTLLEKEVRTPKERLLVDAFLPAPETIPSAFARPAAPPPPADDEPVPAAALRQILGAAAPEEEPAGDPAPPPRRRPRKTLEPEKSLEEEVAEFLSRSSRALAPDPDPET